MNTSAQRMRAGTWIRIEAPEFGALVGFTYLDHTAGFSVQGRRLVNGALEGGQSVIVRTLLPEGATWRELTAQEIEEFQLPAQPEWLPTYGPQPPAGTVWGLWQDHPKLKGKFHPEFPDDLQVIVHDGGPRLSKNPPELMWVRVTGGADNVFTGRLLNQPHALTSLKLGDEIHFVVPDGSEHPLRVTEQYLSERPNWIITPCNKCGLSELFDAPSDLMRVAFPNMPTGASVQLQAFTAFCGSCGGVLLVRSTGAEDTLAAASARESAQPAPGKKKWWQFWK